MVQPFTVMVLELLEPGPLEVDDELELLPPPALMCTEDPPAELELDSEPPEAVDPVVPDPDDPTAVMLPSGCFSTLARQVSPVAVLPVFSVVSAQATLPIKANVAIARIALFIRASPI